MSAVVTTIGDVITIDSSYTGHVSADSNPQQRVVSGARVVKMSVGAMDNNVYLVQCADTGATLLIDAANEAERILELIADQAPDGVELLVTTHRHPDHWWALAEVTAQAQMPTAAHELDAEPLPVPPDRLLVDGDKLRIGNLELEAIHLSGHTPGSIALAFTDGDGRTHLFTGDSLFPGGVGKTGSPQEFTSLLDDVESKLFARYPDDTVVYPGHGDDTTLGEQRPDLPEWRRRGW